MKGIETIIDLVIIEMKGTALDMKEGTIEEKETVREDIVKDRGLDLNLREGATIEMIALETAMTTVKDQENIDLCIFSKFLKKRLLLTGQLKTLRNSSN